MATNGSYIKYNPQWCSKLTKDELIGVLAHEILHCVLGHIFRRRSRDIKIWNCACDYAVNLILSEESAPKIMLPKPNLLDLKYKGMTAEQIYDKLINNEFSGGSSGKPNKDEDKAKQIMGSQFGDADDCCAEGTSDAQTSVEERKWELNVAAATQIAKACGTLSARLERVVGTILNPVLPWREILNRFIIEKAKDDYCWRIPNKRYLWSGTYLPSLDSLKLKTIGIIVDTSGSIAQKEFDEFVAEIKSILSISPETEAEVVYVDAKVCGNERLSSTTDKLSPKGGGGTCFKPGFKYLENKDEEFACILYFTDGECNSFPPEPTVHTLWCVTGAKGFTPPFGEVVYIQEN